MHQLHLLLKLGILLCLDRALLDASINDILTLALFFLRRYLIYDLLLILSFLSSKYSGLLGCILLYSVSLLGRVAPSAL